MSARTNVKMFWRSPEPAAAHRTGVSLHSHSQFSRESLNLIPKYVGGIPILGRTAGNLDYQRAFWTPPLSAREALNLEARQITESLHLPALVSLTDHDDTQAGVDLYPETPISTEWTFPFGGAELHIGLHNLPPYCDRYSLPELHADPNVLIVLNHPLWDEIGIGEARHHEALREFLRQYRPYVHALEVNGLRSWRENLDVFKVASEWDLPVVAGGDRHGREPNALLNISRASTFRDFAEEIRREKLSEIVLMPQYRKPLAWRTTRMVLDALREYQPHEHARCTWRERVFYQPNATVEPIPLAAFLNRGNTPPLLKMLDALVPVILTNG